MPETEQPQLFDEQTDYFQLWKAKSEENTLLSKKLLISKEKVVGLQLKLIDFICSVKSLEIDLDMDTSQEVKFHVESRSEIVDVEMKAIQQSISSFLQIPRTSAKKRDANQNINNDPVLEKFTPIQGTEKTVYKCKFCKKLFAFPNVLKNHLRTHHATEHRKAVSEGTNENSKKHAPTEPRTFQCRVCGKKFKLSIQLSRHQQIHKYDKWHGSKRGQQVLPKGISSSEISGTVHRLDLAESSNAETMSSVTELVGSPEQELHVMDDVSLQLSNRSHEDRRTMFQYHLNPSVLEAANAHPGASKDDIITSNVPELNVNQINMRIKSEATEKNYQKPYAVVEFEENQVGVVCTSWLFDNNTKCYWPPENPSKMTMEGVTPSESWEPCDIVHVLSFADNYKEAQRKLRKSEYTTELSSDNSDAEKRKRKIRQKKFLSESSDEDDDDEEEEEKRRKKSAETELSSCNVNLELLNLPSLNQNSQALMLPIADNNQYAVNLIGDLPSDDHGFDATVDSSIDLSLYEPGFQRTVVRMLDEVREESKHLRSLMQAMLLENNPSCELEVDGLPALPLLSMDNVDVMELVMENKELRTQMVKYLGSLGGGNVKEITKRILSRLISAPLALQFNWAGRNGKRGFQSLSLKSLVIDSVRRNACAKSEPEKVIEEVIKTWFRTALDRLGGREARARQSQMLTTHLLGPE